jgi:putative tryptophan/tyrosine transport system permease protein
MALRVDFLQPGDMKLITAVIVIIALILPKIMDSYREKKRKAKRRSLRLQVLERKGEANAEFK